MSEFLVDFANLEQRMHKSKLAGFIIDCQTTDLDRAADFWGGALGMPVRALPPGEGEIYKQLMDSHHGLHIEVQAVTHPSRIHLDIESDDVEAEVQRLEKLGAMRVQLVRTWWVMEAPTGQRFCVVRATSNDFGAKAVEWP
jgi:predicted enzyme related to lactoylglutathione lyase